MDVSILPVAVGKEVVGTLVGVSSVTSVVNNVPVTAAEVSVTIVVVDDEASVVPVTGVVEVDEILADVGSTVGLSFVISVVNNVAVAVTAVDVSILPVTVATEVDATVSEVD